LQLLRDIPTSIYTLKMLRPGTDVSPNAWVRHCLQDRAISLLQVMNKAKYTEIESSYKNCHIDNCCSLATYTSLSIWHILQNKNCSCTCSEMLNPVTCFYKHSIQSYATLPAAVANASKP